MTILGQEAEVPVPELCSGTEASRRLVLKQSSAGWTHLAVPTPAVAEMMDKE
jgi:hypothetical protein